ncbi:MAG: hypothetical protein MZW92_64545 [Comamonadaceae bacterium]|nr:hypothetical protein [Comamonadaceae bacterium]
MVDDPVPIADLRRALVIKLRHHGDVLLASPGVPRCSKNHAPQLEIDALVYADTRGDARPASGASPSCTPSTATGRSRGAAAQLRGGMGTAAARCARARYDLVVHLTEHPRGAWLARLLRPRFSVAPRRRRCEPLVAQELHPLLLPSRRMRRRAHGRAQPGRAAPHRHLPGGGRARPACWCPGAAGRSARRRAARASTACAPKRFIHLHPTSRWLFKCWPEERNAELDRRPAPSGATAWC